MFKIAGGKGVKAQYRMAGLQYVQDKVTKNESMGLMQGQAIMSGCGGRALQRWFGRLCQMHGLQAASGTSIGRFGRLRVGQASGRLEEGSGIIKISERARQQRVKANFEDEGTERRSRAEPKAGWWCVGWQCSTRHGMVGSHVWKAHLHCNSARLRLCFTY